MDGPVSPASSSFTVEVILRSFPTGIKRTLFYDDLEHRHHMIMALKRTFILRHIPWNSYYHPSKSSWMGSLLPGAYLELLPENGAPILLSDDTYLTLNDAGVTIRRPSFEELLTPGSHFSILPRDFFTEMLLLYVISFPMTEASQKLCDPQSREPIPLPLNKPGKLAIPAFRLTLK